MEEITTVENVIVSAVLLPQHSLRFYVRTRHEGITSKRVLLFVDKCGIMLLYKSMYTYRMDWYTCLKNAEF